MIVEVAALPAALEAVDRKVAVVVDALRASTTVCTMFDAGAGAVVVAADPRDALAIAGTNRVRYVVCGEVGGVPPAGFDYGNSPRQLAAVSLAGKEVVFSTSNGTRALAAVRDARAVYVGSGRNGPAVAAAALETAEATESDLLVLCAGDEGGTLFSLEDFFFAGYLVELIAGLRPFGWPVDEAEPRRGDPAVWVLDESALAARRLYRSYLRPDSLPARPSAGEVRSMFAEARNGSTLPRLGYAGDLEYCAEVARSNVVPRLIDRDGRLVLVAEG